MREFFQKWVKYLISLFNKSEKEVPLKRLGLIVGHSAARCGARNYLGESEWSFNSRIAIRVAEICNKRFQSLLEVKVFNRFGGPYLDLCPDIRLYKPNATIELHFNAAEVRAYGVEALVYEGGPKPYANALIADLITNYFAAEYGVRERHTIRLNGDSVSMDGVKYMSEGRGVYNLKTIHGCNVPYVLIFEPVFGNFETVESIAVFEDEDRYVDFLVKAIGEVQELLI